MMPTFHEWVDDQQAAHPAAALPDELVEIRAGALYRVVYLMERGGKRSDRTQAAASLRSWLAIDDDTAEETL